MTDEHNELEERILLTLSDAISDFLYYDRKEDDYLPLGTIEQALIHGWVSIEELTNHFKEDLIKSVTVANGGELPETIAKPQYEVLVRDTGPAGTAEAKKRVLEYLADGWNLSGVTRIQEGIYQYHFTRVT